VERAQRISLRAAEAALIGHSEVAEGEIVFHRIFGVDFAQCRSDVSGHLPPRARVPSQLETTPDAYHVCVERHDQLGRRHVCPQAEVDGIAAHHPPQEEVQPFAGAARRRPRKEVRDAGTGRAASVGRT
jgi:hypothetical protein